MIVRKIQTILKRFIMDLAERKRGRKKKVLISCPCSRVLQVFWWWFGTPEDCFYFWKHFRFFFFSLRASWSCLNILGCSECIGRMNMQRRHLNPSWTCSSPIKKKLSRKTSLDLNSSNILEQYCLLLDFQNKKA